jgi:DNA invertase Pin-like site-specific DNA recombinase
MKKRPPHETKAPTRVRCAIYTRKSTQDGLEQEFNSLDAQRESAEAYIASQKAEGWHCLPDRYDDGGFTGGNMDRSALGRLMSDIEAGKVDCVVVYKVDRLSRSLIDFARLMALFERKKISVVSVTQQFNTTQSMGRVTLNILLSFAQFEREIISERTRDKIAAARRKGKWSGGNELADIIDQSWATEQQSPQSAWEIPGWAAGPPRREPSPVRRMGQRSLVKRTPDGVPGARLSAGGRESGGLVYGGCPVGAW